MLKSAFDTDAELIKGSGGIFDVTLDGDLLFSKHDEGRFPAEEEVVERIRDARGS